MSDLVRLSHVFEQATPIRKAAVTAGAGLLLVALGWGAGAKIDSQLSTLAGPSPEQVAARAAESAQKALGAEQAHQQEIAALRAHVEGMKSKLDAQAQKARESEAAVAALQKSLSEEKEQAQVLRAHMEKMTARDVKPQQPLVLEAPQPPSRPAASATDRTPTASIGKPLPIPARPLPIPPRPLPAPEPARLEAASALRPPPPAPPKPYRAYVLREISDGMAVVEGEDGMVEAAPGDRLPGGARVQRIERRGGRWVVMTDRGYIAADSRWDE